MNILSLAPSFGFFGYDEAVLSGSTLGSLRVIRRTLRHQTSVSMRIAAPVCTLKRGTSGALQSSALQATYTRLGILGSPNRDREHKFITMTLPVSPNDTNSRL